MRDVPVALGTGPFTRKSARKAGLTDRQLDGARFRRLFPRVFCLVDHEMSHLDWVTAARLALPEDALPTSLTRIQMLGLDFGPARPLHFVLQRDHHLALDGIFLHRTKSLPPTDAVGVTPAAAFIAYCAVARVIDAIKVGDWLLHHEHMTVGELRALALSALWRDGAEEAMWVLDHLDPRSRSIKESEMRGVLVFAGLLAPEVNVAVDVGEDVEVIADLLYREHGVVVEYEGAHHQEDRAQYNSDLDRYALMRNAGVPYVQVTNEKLDRARTLVGEVYRALLARGYAGPPPAFGERWRQLFLPVTAVVESTRKRPRRPAVS